MENLAKIGSVFVADASGGYDAKPATIALNELAGTMAAEFNV